MLSTALADTLGVRRGDAVTVRTANLDLRATVGGLVDEMSGMGAYVSLETMRPILPEGPAVFNGLYVLADPARLASVKAAILQLPGVASVQLKRDVQSDWQTLMGLFYAFMGVLLIFSIAMAFALLFNAVTVNVLERERELATMRAVGAGLGRIAALILTEIGVLWLVTAPFGLILGTWAAVGLGQAFNSELISFQIVISPLSYVITTVGILVTMVISSLPALRHISHLDLAEATKLIA